MVNAWKNGSMVIVPTEVFKTFYEPNGWSTKENKNRIVEKTVENVETEEITEGTEISDAVEDTEVETFENEFDFSTMSVSELKAFAAENDIDISAAKSKRELREIIESEME